MKFRVNKKVCFNRKIESIIREILQFHFKCHLTRGTLVMNTIWIDQESCLSILLHHYSYIWLSAMR